MPFHCCWLLAGAFYRKCYMGENKRKDVVTKRQSNDTFLIALFIKNILASGVNRHSGPTPLSFCSNKRKGLVLPLAQWKQSSWAPRAVSRRQAVGCRGRACRCRDRSRPLPVPSPFPRPGKCSPLQEFPAGLLMNPAHCSKQAEGSKDMGSTLLTLARLPKRWP